MPKHIFRLVALIVGFLVVAAIAVPLLTVKSFYKYGHYRADSVPEIAAQILTHLIEAGEVPLRRFSTAALNALRNQAWAGGYVELRNAVRSLALGALEEEIAIEEVTRLLAPQASAAAHALPLDLPLREAREAFERVYFEHHLQLEGGNMTRLAEKTGLERTHLYRKLKALGIAMGRKGEEQ